MPPRSAKKRSKPSPPASPQRNFTWPRVKADGGPVAYDASAAFSLFEAPATPRSVATDTPLRRWRLEGGDCADWGFQSSMSSEGSGATPLGAAGAAGTSSGKSRRRNRRRRKNRQWIAPAEPNTSVERPCTHNSWDNVRVKKEKTTLRCRACQLQWKVAHAFVMENRCSAFSCGGRCPAGRSCGQLHIHRFKQNLSKRRAIWGEEVAASVSRRGSQADQDQLCPTLQQSTPTSPSDIEVEHLYQPHSASSNSPGSAPGQAVLSPDSEQAGGALLSPSRKSPLEESWVSREATEAAAEGRRPSQYPWLEADEGVPAAGPGSFSDRRESGASERYSLPTPASRASPPPLLTIDTPPATPGQGLLTPHTASVRASGGRRMSHRPYDMYTPEPYAYSCPTPQSSSCPPHLLARSSIGSDGASGGIPATPTPRQSHQLQLSGFVRSSVSGYTHRSSVSSNAGASTVASAPAAPGGHPRGEGLRLNSWGAELMSPHEGGRRGSESQGLTPSSLVSGQSPWSNTFGAFSPQSGSAAAPPAAVRRRAPPTDVSSGFQFGAPEGAGPAAARQGLQHGERQGGPHQQLWAPGQQVPPQCMHHLPPQLHAQQQQPPPHSQPPPPPQQQLQQQQLGGGCVAGCAGCAAAAAGPPRYAPDYGHLPLPAEHYQPALHYGDAVRSRRGTADFHLGAQSLADSTTTSVQAPAEGSTSIMAPDGYATAPQDYFSARPMQPTQTLGAPLPHHLPPPPSPHSYVGPPA